MKAIVCTKYGSPEVLKLKQIEKPTPKSNEVLIKIHSTSINSGDVRIRKANPFIIRLIFGWKKPRKSILGVIVSGEIEAIGKNVTNYKVGDKVFGSTGMNFGTYAEYVAVSEDATLALIPSNLTYEEAAAIPFGATASLHFLRKATIKPGHHILIYGASGALGTAAIQLAKSFGTKVTAVCSTTNIDLVKRLGADNVIDYTQEEFTKRNTKYDIIYDTVNKSPFCDSYRSLKKRGKLLLASAGICRMLVAFILSAFGSRNIIAGVVKETAQDMNYIKSLIEAGKLTATIDKTYDLVDIRKAHKYVDKGHKKGNVIIRVA